VTQLERTRASVVMNINESHYSASPRAEEGEGSCGSRAVRPRAAMWVRLCRRSAPWRIRLRLSADLPVGAQLEVSTRQSALGHRQNCCAVREDDRLNPHIRSRLCDAVAALSDEELHERRWLRGVMMNEDEMDFDDAVLLVVDELATPDPRELIGHVLVDERELAAFVALLTDPWVIFGLGGRVGGRRG